MECPYGIFAIYMAIWAKQNILQYAAVCILKDQHNVCKKTHTHTWNWDIYRI